MLKIYGLKKCSTTQKVANWMNDQGHELTDIIDIRDCPPSIEELKYALEAYSGKRGKIVNSSGQLYRDLHLKDKLDEMSEDEFLTLLSEQGMLVKRPLITDGKKTSTGSNQNDLARIWSIE